MVSKHSNDSDGPHEQQDKLNRYLAKFEAAALDHTAATIAGDHIKANRSVDVIMDTVAHLKQRCELVQLKRLLSHSSAGVRVWAASYLLPTNLNTDAISTLQKIEMGTDMIAFAAEMTLREWKNGRLKV